MGAIADVMALEDQEKLDQQAAAASAVPRDPVKTDGFHMPKMPASAFPKGLKAGGEFHVAPDQLHSVKAQMVGDLGRLTSALSQVISYGAFGSAIGGWDTADAFGSNAYEAITQFMQALNTAYDMVATNVGKAAQNYTDADDTTQSAASTVGSEASG